MNSTPVVVALGGNALVRRGEPTDVATQRRNVVRAMTSLAWSKLGTSFGGVSVDVLLDEAEPKGRYVMAFCHEGYTTNLQLDDLTGGKAWVATHHEAEPLTPEHGGPARLLVPHLYFWKSAKWVAGLRIMDHEEPGFWETNGYHLRGDPWKEERYWSD